MRSKQLLTFTILSLAVLATAAVMAAPAPTPTPTQATASVVQSGAAGRVQQQPQRNTHTPANPLMPQIKSLLDQERQQLAELSLRARQAADFQEELAIERQVAGVKKDTERAIMELQLDYARKQGNQETVASLEQAIASMDAPPPAPVRVERDIPTSHNHR